MNVSLYYWIINDNHNLFICLLSWSLQSSLIMNYQLILHKPDTKNVDRYTRAGKDGKSICCPNCEYWETVYHFSWSALVCQHCKESINKDQWKVEVT